MGAERCQIERGNRSQIWLPPSQAHRAGELQRFADGEAHPKSAGELRAKLAGFSRVAQERAQPSRAGGLLTKIERRAQADGARAPAKETGGPPGRSGEREIQPESAAEGPCCVARRRLLARKRGGEGCAFVRVCSFSLSRARSCWDT